MNNKHAYLVMCHKNKHQIRLLLKLLDNKRNDIYLLIDGKSKLKISDFENVTKESDLKIFKKGKIVWGDYSIVKSTLFLLKKALTRHHDYYHLISGQCLPIKPMDEIFTYFDNNLMRGKEFIHYKHIVLDAEETHGPNAFYKRYRFFSKTLGIYWAEKQNFIKRRFLKVIDNLERKLLMFQIKKNLFQNKELDLYWGSQWFSITHNLASFVVSKEKEIKKKYRFTKTPDESFLQTFAMMSPYRNNILNDNLRLIIWKNDSDSPRILTMSDWNKIFNSTALFARKFDETVDAPIINKICDAIVK